MNQLFKLIETSIWFHLEWTESYALMLVNYETIRPYRFNWAIDILANHIEKARGIDPRPLIQENTIVKAFHRMNCRVHQNQI